MVFRLGPAPSLESLHVVIWGYRQATKHLGPCRVSAGKQNGQWMADLIVEVRK